MLFEPYGTSLLGSGSTPYGFNVIWSATGFAVGKKSINRVLDNVASLAIDVYSCENLATNCGRCLTLDADKYDCGWCSLDSKCARPHQCSNRQIPENWLNASQLCPNPVIEDFKPKKGSIFGGTRVTINGINLGRHVSDVEKAVQIANVPCEVVEYVPSQKIVCVTGKSPIKGSNERGVVAVTLRHDSLKFFAHSTEHFSYVQPVVSSMKPVKGPRSGGTDVTLTGVDLDTGAEVTVRFGQIGCKILERASGWLRCRMGASGEGGQFPLHIAFDGQLQNLPIPIYFEFTSDPSVQSISPNKTIPSGGITVDVYGQGFTLLQRPRMVFTGLGDEKSYGPACSIEDDQMMKCATPTAPGKDSDRGSQERITEYAFDFDGAELYRSRIKVMPSPTFETLSEPRFVRPGEDFLTLNGNHLNLAASERDIDVKVGGEPCPLTALANKVLTCQPPVKKPRGAGKLNPEIVVTVGNASFSIGEVSYDSPGLSSSLFFIIMFFIIFMIALIICLIVLYRRKSNTHQRQMKYLKTQMDTIEMKVATECKEAFAELQTSLNQYTADLPLGTPTAPFLEYKDYCARVLFPNAGKNHAVLKNLEVDTHKAEAIEAGLREFHKLLMNKTFLLTMVRTMEANKYFVGKDRVYVGSLLMVVLQEKMGYCTEMLKQLLRELIEKTVEKKFQPKILFRRSESIAERMLAAWFTFLLHDHLKTYDAGKKLYELFWGIKQQMEKGPQDALTLEARYSLSEEKLLRATFEYKELMVFVSASDSVYSSTQDIPVRVLDCDTITQVKEKCLDAKYRGYRFADRPAPGDMELEWKTGMNGKMALQDIDSSSRVEGGNWKRLNTLAHYNVPNNAILTLTSKSNSLYNLVNFSSTSMKTASILSDRSEKSSVSMKTPGVGSPKPWGAPPSVIADHASSSADTDNGFKLYHLVKPTEHGPTDSQEKMVTEIYLTRLLMMKGTLAKFITSLLESIFSSSTVPPCIKYMFDFMDEQAREHGINDPEVVHAWKSNALPLRFWVNLIKNPHFLFDIQKPTKIEGCLSVVAQTLMDACSTQDHQLTKDSPSSKLLFAKDMYQYRDLVDSYYTEISMTPRIDDATMGANLSAESRQHNGEFHVFSALNELYKYLDQYKESIIDALESNEHAQASRLPGRLQDLLALMESDYYRATDYESSTLGLGYNSNSRLMPRDRL
ncbi:Sema domain-containing protein [Caenorhabditis elegans]|nr:Sema domain-containing protein [Caenorhabditis elegans]CDH93357.1 Sema domain-containing protein [Caenorhabditis elegans]|eukprot:NP_001294558.1 PLeXin [Caenorhabditis elegans]